MRGGWGVRTRNLIGTRYQVHPPRSSLPYEEIVELDVGRDHVGFHRHHSGAGWPQPQPVDQAIDRIVVALSKKFHSSIPGITHPAMETEGSGGHPRCLAVPDSLDLSPHDCLDRLHV